RTHLDVRRQSVSPTGLGQHHDVFDTLRQCADLRNRRGKDRMIGIDALRTEDESPHQKKSVSPRVKRQARGSGASLPASGLPMKWRDIGVGTKPHERYAAAS